MPYDIFISYSRRDNTEDRITQLVDHIRADFARFAERELFPFFDQQEINGMQDWRQRILQGLRESRLLLACLSPAYLQSEYCQWEFVEYLKYEIGHLHGFNGVAPIYFVEVPGWDSKEFGQQCAAWVAELRKRQHFDLRPWHDQGEAALREAAVRERMGKLNRQIIQIITRGERAEKSLGNVDAHNPHFIGRTANLRMLRENFVKPGHIGVVTAVNGVGGLGKTALAIEYAHAFADEYGGGRWQVRCAGKDDLRLALAELATPVGFEFTDDEKKNADLQFERARRELKRLADAREPHRSLLLLDNVDRPGLLDPAQVARINGGNWLHVLATTRLGEYELHGAHHDRSFLAVDELPLDDALALIESYQPDGRFRSEAERDAGREIVRLLGSFTLAVESAAVYLGQFPNDVACAAFLARLKKEGLEGLDIAASQSGEGVLHGEKRLSATLQPTLERLGAAEQLALQFAALVPPDQVPLPWLRALVAKKFPEMERDAEPGYPDPWKTVLRSLFSLRLLQATDDIDQDGQPRVVRVHRIVQAVVRKSAAGDLQGIENSLMGEVKARANFLREGWIAAENRWEIPPLSAFAAQALDVGQADAPELANQSAICLRELGNFAGAEPLFRRALEACGRSLGPEHPDTLASMNNLALLLQFKGDYAGAEPLQRKALEAQDRALGPEHSATLQSVSNLGLLLMSKDDIAGAESLFRRVLEARERLLGPEHPDTLRSVNDLAVLLHQKGDKSGAELCFRRALVSFERVLGPTHPDTLTSINNLAGFLSDNGDYEGAKPLHQRALEAQERVLGPEHPLTLTSMNNLGTLLGRQGDYAGAEPLFRRALEGRERVLGPDHRDTLSTLGNLVIICGQAGRATEAIHFAQREIDAQERTLGSTHPELIRSLNQHAHVLRIAGLAAKAESVDRRSVSATVKVLGEAHPLAIHRRNNLALTLIMLNKLEEARQILAANWRLNAPPHANTTPRIAFLGQIIALLESQTGTPFLGQIKNLLTGPELPVDRNVAASWDIAYFIESLKPNLGEHHAEFVTALVAALNHRAKLPDLDWFPQWKGQPAISLDVPWPER